jgi:hypothetical protein
MGRPSPPPRAFVVKKGSSNAVADISRNTRTVVANFHSDGGRRHHGAYEHRAALSNGLGGVEQQIHKRGAHQSGIHVYGCIASVNRDSDPGASGIPPYERDRIGDERMQVEVNRLRRPRPCKEHQIINELTERIDARDDVLHDRYVRITLGSPRHEHLQRHP